MYDVDTEVSLLTPTHPNSLFNRDEISIRGVLFDVDAQEEKLVKIPVGSILHAYLYMGSDCVQNRATCANTQDLHSTEDWIHFYHSNSEWKADSEMTDDSARGVGLSRSLRGRTR